MNANHTFSLKTAAPRRGVRRVAACVAIALSGTLALSAWAEPDGPMHGHGPGPGGFMHRGGGQPGGPGALFMASPEHISRMVDRMLDGVGASDAQRSQIKQIATAAAADLKQQRDAGRGAHEKAMALLAAPTIDAQAAETLRQQSVARHDQASKRVLQATLAIANVLTPEQRAKLGERAKQRGERMREHMERMQHDRGAHPAG